METLFNALRKSPIKRGPKRWVGGVCGGISAKFGWDAGWVRVGTLLSFLLPVIGIGLYLVLWLVLPKYDGTIALERIIAGK